MDWLRIFAARIVGLFGKRSSERELGEEVREHLKLLTEENLRRGMTPAEARFAAQREFGGVEQTKELYRDRRGLPWLDTLFQDIRFGLRMLRKAPGFTAVAVLTLALGIGANTAIFSIVNGVILKPLPFPQPENLVRVSDLYPMGAFVEMRAQMRTLDVGAYHSGAEFNLTGLGEPGRLTGASVSAKFFSLLGASASLGRVFQPGEDVPGKDRVVLLSYSLWEQKFGRDGGVLGRWISLSGQEYQVVGVMPAGFAYPSPKTQLWVPLHLDPRQVGAYWGGGFMPVIGRLRPGATLEQAHAEIRSLVPRLRSMFPWRMPDALWSDAGVVSLLQDTVGDVRMKLFLLLGAIGLVLLIACANVANLQLARAATRQREITVRAALGANRWRICRQLLTESVLLAILGGSLGLLLAVYGLAWLKSILPADTPRLSSVAMDWRVLFFTAGAALLTGLIFGLAPALHASKVHLAESLKTGGRGAVVGVSHRLRSALAIVQVALGVVLVIAAGLMVRSLWALGHVNPGFRSESVIAARITPSDSFCRDFARCRAFYEELLGRVRAVPGVEDAALVNVLPLSGRVDGFAADLEDHPRVPSDPAPMLFESVITPDYLRLMGIPVLRGRGFTPADTAPSAAPVVLVTASTARKYWPDQDPVGKHVKPVFVDTWMTVVGVIGDVAEDSLAITLPNWCDGAIFDAYGNSSLLTPKHGRQQPTEMTLVVRASSDPSSLAAPLRGVVAGLNPEVPVSEVQTLRSVVTRSVSAPHSTMSLFGIFAALALVLGAVGVYGVISYSVAQRTPEIGLRMALGALPSNVLRLVLAQGVRLALIGILVGLGGAFACTRLLATLLFGVSAVDPLTFGSVAVLLLGVALTASYLPARRATRIDPIVALRYE